jgi:hypothetical protein
VQRTRSLAFAASHRAQFTLVVAEPAREERHVRGSTTSGDRGMTRRQSTHRTEEALADRRPAHELAGISGATLLEGLLSASRLDVIVPLVIDILLSDPLASAGSFRGDLLRGLMAVPGRFWSRNPELYGSYRAAVRAGALARRRESHETRMEFWSELPGSTTAK